MKKYDIIKKIEAFAPIYYTQKWDCVGFMAQTSKQNIEKIMLALTPTNDVVRQALEQNCDMLITHHPLFEIDLLGGLVDERFFPKIDIYSAHTNMDLAFGGTTDTLIEKVLLLGNLELVRKNITEEDFVRYIELKEPLMICDLTELLRKISPNLRYINNNNYKTVKKIGFCAGSGSEFINNVQENGADCFVTGDLKFHTALDSKIVVYDIGHFESEILILDKFKDIIGDDVEIVFAKERSPFIY